MAVSSDPKPGVGTMPEAKLVRVKFIKNAVIGGTVFYEGWEANLREDDAKAVVKDKAAELVAAPKGTSKTK